MMQSARKLILVDESDREYKRLPTNAVAKTKHSSEVSNTLRDSTLADDQKVREYVAALHRYLNLRKQVPVEPTVQVNPITVAHYVRKHVRHENFLEVQNTPKHYCKVLRDQVDEPRGKYCGSHKAMPMCLRR